MPQVALTAAAAIISVTKVGLVAVGVPGTLAGALAPALLKAAAYGALGAASSALLKPSLPSSVIATDWVADPNAPIPALAGRMKVPGNVVYKQSFGPERMYRGIVGVWSVGPIEEVETIKADGTVATFGVGGAANSPFNDKLWFSYKTGLWSDTALASPTGLRSSATIPQWGSNHRLPCLASYMVTFGHDAKQKVWTQGEPEFEAILKGMRCYDPRKDSTYPGGSGSHRLNDPSTWEYSTNPGLWALKWEIGIWMGPNNGRPYEDTLALGLGTPWDDILVDDFIEAANVADALEFTCAGRPTSGDDKDQVLRAFLQAAGASPRSLGGRQGCMIRASEKVSLLTLTRDDIAGAVEITRNPGRLERLNTIIPRYRSEAHDWDMVPAEAVSRDIYLTEDGERRRSREVDYHFVTDLDQAAVLAAYDVADSREGWTGAIPCMPWLRDLAPGDCFTVDDDVEVIGGLKMIVLTRDFDVSTGLVTLGVRAETDSKHAWAGGITGAVTDPTDPVVPGYTFPAPDAGDWSLAAGTGDLPALVFSGEVTNPLAAAVQFAYRLDGAADWIPAAQTGANVEEIAVPLLTGGDWEGAVRYQSDQSGVWGAWLELGPVTVGGLVPTDWTDITSRPGWVTDGRVPAGLDGSGNLISTVSATARNASNLVYRSTGSIDFTGDANATNGANWATNLTGRPTELTDGRIPTALNSSGVLQTPIPSSLADTSNILRRSGGGLFTGSLSATNGADWSTNVSNRPAELTDGRITTALDASGNLKSTAADASGLLRVSGTGGLAGALATKDEATVQAYGKLASNTALSTSFTTVASASLACDGRLVQVFAGISISNAGASGTARAIIEHERQGSPGTWDMIASDSWDIDAGTVSDPVILDKVSLAGHMLPPVTTPGVPETHNFRLRLDATHANMTALATAASSTGILNNALSVYHPG
ncbi:phage tail protein [Brevundimonas sp. 2R-24]|uniref:Phage tail protein n=1 Tax=Peiella sedimenti TaxID=3061083 RepID=A0ABT8SPC2_9CAUL|nr:phage tail protein [Caulobacteraceae bacterium XZ-24]